jgi:putative redox protein
MPDIDVRHLDGDRFSVRIRGHVLLVDQPVEDGGADFGPSPTELFAASLASCVGFYAERFLRRHGIPTAGLHVTCSYDMAEDRPPRVEAVRLHVKVPAGMSAVLRRTLNRVVEACTVHNSIRIQPEVWIEVDAMDVAA